MGSSFLEDIDNLGKEIRAIKKDKDILFTDVQKLKQEQLDLVYKKDCRDSHKKVDSNMCGLTDRVNRNSERISQLEGKSSGLESIMGRILGVVEAQQILLSAQSSGILANKKSTIAIIGGIATVGGAVLIKIADFILSKVNI